MPKQPPRKTSPARSRKNVTKERRYLVFISHSSRDRYIARKVAEDIYNLCGEHGVEVFLDERDIEGGTSITEVIRRNIETCDEFLVLLSSYSISSQWVLTEIGGAWILRKLIVAIVDKVTPQQVPPIIGDYKAIDLNRLEEYLEQLLKCVKGRNR